MNKITCCGSICKECEYFGNVCAGCDKIKGKVFWLEYTEESICDIFDCCFNGKHFENCSKCDSLPCDKYLREEPSKSHEENRADLNKQIIRLNKEGDVHMFESRCGIECSKCEGKADVNCKGCINMDKPFWGGDCPVKTCCENKKLNHCGLCDAFPCEILLTMGADQGYDPSSKIEMCKKWSGK